MSRRASSTVRLLRLARVAGGAALMLVAIGGVAYAIVAALPAPTTADRVAVKVLRDLSSTRGRGGVLELNGETQTVSCRRLPGGRHLIALGDGTRLVLSGTHARVAAAPVRLRMLASVLRRRSLVSAEADLSGSHALYATQLAAQLNHGRSAVRGSTVVGGTRVYRVRLTQGRPVLELLVSRQSLVPLVALYRSADVTGRTVLGRSTGLDRWRAC